MSGVWRNIDPPTPSPPGECVYPPSLWCGGRTHSLGGEGVEGSIVRSSEDARHCSVLYTCKYFVAVPINQQYFSVSEQTLGRIRQHKDA
jgi:hypothetical protein